MWHTLGMIIMVVALQNCQGVSFNRPNLTFNSTWEAQAITVANESAVGLHPMGIFVSAEDTLYVTDRQRGRVLVWANGSLLTPTALATNANGSMSVFVTDNGDVFVDNGQVDPWSAGGTNSSLVIHVNSACTGLFIDLLDRLYCSSASRHHVFRQEPNIDVTTIVGGTGCPGPAANMLDTPHGIFVDVQSVLFVADTRNHRIQRFAEGQLDAETVAGFGAPLTAFLLNTPTGVILDGDGHLFVVDSGNHRIVRSMLSGFECLFGCAGESGQLADQLNSPHAMAFDSSGNIFLTDSGNNRIQKILIKQLCASTPSIIPVIDGMVPAKFAGIGMVINRTGEEWWRAFDTSCYIPSWNAGPGGRSNYLLVTFNKSYLLTSLQLCIYGDITHDPKTISIYSDENATNLLQSFSFAQSDGSKRYYWLPAQTFSRAVGFLPLKQVLVAIDVWSQWQPWMVEITFFGLPC